MFRFLNWDETAETAERGPVHAAAMLLLILVLFGGAIGLGSLALGAAQDAPATIRYNYEWFHNKNERIQSLGVQIRNAQGALEAFEASAGERASWHRADRTDYSRLTAVVLGLQQQLAELVADYNARSNMVNRSIFKGRDLPDYIDINDIEGAVQ